MSIKLRNLLNRSRELTETIKQEFLKTKWARNLKEEFDVKDDEFDDIINCVSDTASEFEIEEEEDGTFVVVCQGYMVGEFKTKEKAEALCKEMGWKLED